MTAIRDQPSDRARFLAALILLPPEAQAAMAEEMRQMIACTKPCAPVFPTLDELRREAGRAA